MKNILRKLKSFFFNIIIKEKILKGEFIIEHDSEKFLHIKNFKFSIFYSFNTEDLRCFVVYYNYVPFCLYGDEAMLFLKRIKEHKVMKKQYNNLLEDL